MAAKAKWVQVISAKLRDTPLYHHKTERKCVCKHCAEEKNIPVGRKVALYQVTNYRHEFDHCDFCGMVYS